MSKVAAARTEASPDEQSSRGYDLCEELDKKLTQAKGVCGAMLNMNTIDTITGEALWALESLIEDAEKAFDELRDIYLDSHPEGGAIMSDDMASTDPMPAGSGEQPQKASDLRDEIHKKLAEIEAFCHAIRTDKKIDQLISSSLWAVSGLIEDAKKAVDDLYEQAARSAEKGVQS